MLKIGAKRNYLAIEAINSDSEEVAEAQLC